MRAWQYRAFGLVFAFFLAVVSATGIAPAFAQPTAAYDAITPFDVASQPLQPAQAGGVCADQNDDGAVDIFDAIIDLQIIVGLIQASAEQKMSTAPSSICKS